MHVPDLSADDIIAGPKVKTFGIVALLTGLVGLGGAAVLALSGYTDTQRFLFAYLVSYCFYVSVALGCLFFTFIHHLTSAGWSVVVRRLAEITAANVLTMAVLLIPILLGRHQIFMWLDPEVAANDALIIKKAGYLSESFFLIRCVLYFAIWGALAWFFLSRSLKQDETGDFRISILLKKVAAPTAIIFALTLTFFAFDMLMSLDPHWFSTIFGVYYFSGTALCGFASLTLMAFFAQRTGRLNGIVTAEHYMDLGKYLFGFTIFWTYIAFSQYMLIWYGNIPEETTWFLRRQTGEWANFSWFLLIGHFVIPFIALISRYPKRRPKLLVFPALWILAMHYIDIYYLAMPELPPPGGAPGVVPFAMIDLVCFIGIGGCFAAFTFFAVHNRSLIPKRDPRLAESLAFQNIGG